MAVSREIFCNLHNTKHMTFEKDRGVSIDKAFKKFHKSNPDVFERFKHYFYHFHGLGIKKVGSKLIIECVRREPNLRTKGSGFKIDNCFTPLYGRLFVRYYPQYKNCFEFRRLKSDPVQTKAF